MQNKKPLLCVNVCVSGFFFMEKFKHTIHSSEKPVVVNLTLKYLDVSFHWNKISRSERIAQFPLGHKISKL